MVMERVRLLAGAMRMEIAPFLGGAILSLERAGRPLLRPTPEAMLARLDARMTACFPMLPFANRITNGIFDFAGQRHCLALNVPGIAHTVHGCGWQRPWEPVTQGPARLSLRLVHRPVGEGDWPFPFMAGIDYRLSPDGLRIAMTLVNDGATPAPAGLGLHPYFIRERGTCLRFSALSPPLSPDLDFQSGRCLDDVRVDADFHAWSGAALVMGGEGRAGVELRASAPFGSLRLYVPEGRDFFALEPVSHGADALNDRMPPPMAILVPGACLSGIVEINPVQH